MHRIVKRQAHSEPYQRHKLHASIEAICRSAQDFAGAAELTAEQVCDHVENWLSDKTEITSVDVRNTASKALQLYNPHAAILYSSHLNIN